MHVVILVRRFAYWFRSSLQYTCHPRFYDSSLLALGYRSPTYEVIPFAFVTVSLIFLVLRRLSSLPLRTQYSRSCVICLLNKPISTSHLPFSRFTSLLSYSLFSLSMCNRSPNAIHSVPFVFNVFIIFSRHHSFIVGIEHQSVTRLCCHLWHLPLHPRRGSVLAPMLHG